MDIINFWLENLPTMIDGLIVSLQVTGMALAIGIPMGLLLALGVKAKGRLVRYLCIAFVEIGRGAPALIMLQFMYFGLPQAGVSLTSFAAAAVALAWTTSAYTSEIIRSGLEAVPHGQQEAAVAVGFTRIDALRYIIVPQGLRVAAPALLGFSILMLQATSLCFAIALPELLSQAYMIGTNTFQYLPILLLSGLLYASICIPATIAVSLMEKSLSRHTL